MKLMLGLLVFSIYIVTAHCSLQTIVANPGGIGGIFKGPDSETIVKGPDGSIITSEQKGGIIQTDHKLEPIIVAEPEIVEANYILPPSLAEDGYIAPLAPVENVVSPAYANNIIPEVNSGIFSSPTANPIGPGLIAPLEPVVRETIPISLGHKVDIIEPEPHIIQTEIVDAPAIEPKESTDLVGPSGSISTRGSESIVSGPASTTITKTAKVLIAPPVISAAAVIPYTIQPVRAPPLIEVNNEIPVVSTGPITTATSGAPPLYPLNTGGLSVSTLSPPVASTPLPLGPIIQQPVPIQPPIFSTGLLTGEEFNVKYQTPTIIKTPTTINPIQGQSVIPRQTPIVSIEDEGASGFIQPGSIYGTGTIPSSTLSPILSSTSSFYEGIPSSTISPTTSYGIIDSQHALNPSDIPTRNIIPPEIGVSRGAIDLGTTVTSVTKEQDVPRANGLINLQGIDTDNIQRAEYISDRIGNENTFQNGYYQTDVLLGTGPNSVYPQQKTATINEPLLTETNPIPYQNGINGIPQYVNGQTPVFSEPGISSHSDYNDRPAGNLWNRYGRKRRNRIY